MVDRVPEARTNRVVLCVRCGYDLSGLGTGGHCPECACPIRNSLKPRARPWPSWLRHLRTVYFTAWGVIIAAPFALPPIGTALGMSVITGRRAASGDVLFLCIIPTAVLGFVLACALQRRDHWLTWIVAGTLALLGWWALAALGG
jgi:hypothetical protein